MGHPTEMKAAGRSPRSALLPKGLSQREDNHTVWGRAFHCPLGSAGQQETEVGGKRPSLSVHILGFFVRNSGFVLAKCVEPADRQPEGC